MEHIINVTEVQKTQVVSNHHIEPSTQDKIGSPVVSQLRDDYSLLPSNTPDERLPSRRQELQSLPVDVRKFANPAPLGLCAFALTSFLSNCINLNVGGIQASGVSVSLALNYGGIAQVLAGMWYVLSILGIRDSLETVLSRANESREMAIGNTFGATSFCSYGAYWITFSLISTFDTADATKDIVDPVCHNETLMGLFMLVSHFYQIQALVHCGNIC